MQCTQPDRQVFYIDSSSAVPLLWIVEPILVHYQCYGEDNDANLEKKKLYNLIFFLFL
jgi:hypothetical protein